jgi:hypothetical protein
VRFGNQKAAGALTWRQESGCCHAGVAPGETNPAKDHSPISEPDGLYPINEAAKLYPSKSTDSEAITRSLVTQKFRADRGKAACDDARDV